MSKLSTAKKNVLHLVGMTLVVGSGLVHLGYALHERQLADASNHVGQTETVEVAANANASTPSPSHG